MTLVNYQYQGVIKLQDLLEAYWHQAGWEP